MYTPLTHCSRWRRVH